MLVSFSVANFRSFADEQTFSLRAHSRLAGAQDHRVLIPGSDDEVLRTGLIYGPNNVGKSNLLHALRYLRTIALGLDESTRGAGRRAFRSAHLNDEPSTFELQFIAQDRLYCYEVSVNDQRILRERISHVRESQQLPIYERQTDRTGNVAVSAPQLIEENDQLSALIMIAGKVKRSFLATARSTLEPQDRGCALNDVIRWFEGCLKFIGQQSACYCLSQHLVTDAKLRRFASEFLRATDTGIDHLTVTRTELSEPVIQCLVPENRLATTLARIGPSDKAVLKTIDGEQLLVEREGEVVHFYHLEVRVVHKNKLRRRSTSPLSEESSGTLRVLELLPALYQARSGGTVYCIDEIDRSLHPLWVAKLFEYFLNSCAGVSSQLIATTHQPHLLDLAPLRQDEIWLAEKNYRGATQLSPLTRFNTRKRRRALASCHKSRRARVNGQRR
jgi:hypothetical protein